MTLGDKQRKFALLIAQLKVWIYEQGYEVTEGDYWAKSGHVDGSFHYKRLAADLNLFKDRRYLIETEDHRFIGDKWKSMDSDCTWGGDFSRPDGNHYSYGEHKRK